MRPSPERGFTLLEVMVALTIVMLALGVFTASALDGARALRESARVEEALVRARSRLARIAAQPVAGDFLGDDGDGFQWRVTTRVLESHGQPPASAVTMLYAITVRISWRGGTRGREVRLDAERLFTPPPDAPRPGP